MGGGSIPYLINGFHRRVDCGVETNGVIRTCNVQIDGSRKSDGIDAQSRKRLCAAVGAVAADYHQTVDSVLLTDIRTALLYLRIFELRTSGCSQNRTASLDNIGDILCLHIYDLFIQKAHIASLYTLNIQSSGNCSTHNCADCGIHTGGVAAACQHGYCLYMICHDSVLLNNLFYFNPISLHFQSFL